MSAERACVLAAPGGPGSENDMQPTELPELLAGAKATTLL